MCGYSFEAPCPDASIEYPQHMFLWRKKYPRIITQYSSLSKKSSVRPHFACLLAVQDMCKNIHEDIRKGQQGSSMVSEGVGKGWGEGSFDQITVLTLRLRTDRPTLFATHPPNLNTFTDTSRKHAYMYIMLTPLNPTFI